MAMPEHVTQQQQGTALIQALATVIWQVSTKVLCLLTMTA